MNFTEKNEKTEDSKPKGGQLENKNAIKHGIYSCQPQSEEKLLFKKKLKLFKKTLGKANIFDEQQAHALALITAKFDIAMEKNASAELLIPLGREILNILRALKETRDTRDDSEKENIKTAADLLIELEERDRNLGLSTEPDNIDLRIYEMEKEINDLRKKLNMPHHDDINHKEDLCEHCKKTAEHRKNINNEWVCLECGYIDSQM